MKNKLFIHTLTACVILLFSSAECEKSTMPVTEISKLPPATQTGADTFGCLVDGIALTPRGSMFSGPNLQCEYQYLVNNTQNGYYFSLAAYDKKTFHNEIHVIRLRADSVELEVKKYVLNEQNTKGKLAGIFEMTSGGLDIEYSTNTILLGELNITKFDLPNQIISGTFWFDAINSNNEKVEVREGRFDVHLNYSN